VPVVKHGNRSISSKCGSVDCLEELGVTPALEPNDVLSFLTSVGIVFLSAPVYHPLVGTVAEARRSLAARGSKTVFNVLGPLVNPASVSRRALGVFCEKLITPVAEALRELGVDKAAVYHGNGQDEVTLTGVTLLAHLSNGEIRRGWLSPEDLGFARCTTRELAGGSAADNARIAREILDGRVRDARRDIVVLNAAVGIQVAADEELSLQECVDRATDSIDSGRASAVLKVASGRSRV
jgi:anthranilate phosphoribosyltransferase